MPFAPLKPCPFPGCPVLGPCPIHRRIRTGKTAERGYDAAHKRVRVLCFQRDGWRCVSCGWEPDIVKDFRIFNMGPPPADRVLDELRGRFHRKQRHLQADHKIPVEDRPELRLVLENLQTLCDECHRRKTNQWNA